MQHYHPYTRGHLKRVADMSERLARELRLPVESIRHMNAAAFLHDIGKIGVSEEILDKPAQLTDDEWAKIKEHPVKGAEIISHLEFLEGIVDWIKYHHKWHNGAGYPATNGDGSEIPIEAAIIATADAFDAMTDDRELTIEWKCDCCGFHPDDGDRPVECPQCGAEKRRRYREPRNQDDAIDELRRGAGTQFHPRVVKAFLSMVERDGIRLNA
jgi:putative nucleotidyltransferase with HDIG domain